MTTTERLRTALADADFPAQKADLVRCAQRSEADQDTVRALKAIPPVVYETLGEVEQSVSFDSGDRARDRAQQRRTHTKPGLAESEKDTPSHPIIDELGENRGS